MRKSVCVIVMCSFWSVVCGDDSYLEQRLLVGKCRARCLKNFATSYIRFNYHEVNNMGCTTKANWKCNMCWDYCESLAVYAKTRNEMCNDEICMEGCKLACKFYTGHQQQTSSPSTTTLQLFEPKVTKSKVTWNYDSHGVDRKVLFVVLGLRMDNNGWTEIQQTSETKVLLPAKYKQIRIYGVCEDCATTTTYIDKQLVYSLLPRSKRNANDSALMNHFCNNMLIIGAVIVICCLIVVTFAIIISSTRRKQLPYVVNV